MRYLEDKFEDTNNDVNVIIVRKNQLKESWRLLTHWRELNRYQETGVEKDNCNSISHKNKALVTILEARDS